MSTARVCRSPRWPKTLFEQLGARHHATSVPMQPAHDPDLSRRERDAFAAAHHGHAGEIDHGSIELDFVERFARRRTTAGRANAREQFTRGEGLGDVVVGAFDKALYLVVLGSPCRQHHDRHPGSCRTQSAADLHAVEPREHEIEQHDIERFAQAGFDAGHAIGGRCHLVAISREEIGNAGSQARFVFNHEDAHDGHSGTPSCKECVRPLLTQP